jgi:hypothetical protein
MKRNIKTRYFIHYNLRGDLFWIASIRIDGKAATYSKPFLAWVYDDNVELFL